MLELRLELPSTATEQEAMAAASALNEALMTDPEIDQAHVTVEGTERDGAAVLQALAIGIPIALETVRNYNAIFSAIRNTLSLFKSKDKPAAGSDVLHAIDVQNLYVQIGRRLVKVIDLTEQDLAEMAAND